MNQPQAFLTPEQQTKLQQWMMKKRINPKCAACGANVTWASGAIISAPVMDENKNTTLGGSTVPMVQISCPNCGYTMLFAAVPIGLFKD
jgi:hypothetical protein